MTPRRLLAAFCISGLALVPLLSAQQESSTPPPTATPTPAESASSGSAPPAQGVLTIDEAVRRALEHNFTLEIQAFSPQIAADAIDVAREAYRPTISVSASEAGSRAAPSGTSPGSRSETTDIQAGVSQRLETGAIVGVTTRLDRSEFNPTLSSLNPAYNSDVSLSVRQPLLQGAGLAVNRASIERAKIGLDRANLDYTAARLDVVQATESAYYNLAFAREQLEVRKFSLDLAQRLFDEAKTRRDTGVATDLDVLQAEVGVANARRSVLLSEQDVKDRTEALLALIGQFQLDEQVGATPLPKVSEALPTYASSLAAAKQNQPDYLSAQAALDQVQLDLLVARRNMLPNLSVGGAVGFNGTNNDLPGSFGDTIDREDSSWQVDLSLSYPWGRIGDKARYRQTLASVTQQKLRIRQLEQQIEVDVRSAVRAVETNAESLKISSLARELSEKQYDLEKAKFEAGLSTSRRVLEAQDDLETARVNELLARVNLRISISSLHRIEGSSLRRYGYQQ